MYQSRFLVYIRCLDRKGTVLYKPTVAAGHEEYFFPSVKQAVKNRVNDILDRV